MSDHIANWDFTIGLFTILVYDFNAPDGLVTSPTLWPLVFWFETHDLIVRGVHSKYTIGWVGFPTRLFWWTSVRKAWRTGKDPVVPIVFRFTDLRDRCLILFTIL